jgi:hypothetical protein
MSSLAVIPIHTRPQYQLRMVVETSSIWRLEIHQLPSPATPRLTSPEHVGTLKGTALRLVENRILKRLARERIILGAIRPGKAKTWPLDEESALLMGLLFRALAPMKNFDRIREVAEGVEAMSREEAGYWLGMVLHRRQPRRVLASLRLLLTSH